MEGRGLGTGSFLTAGFGGSAGSEPASSLDLAEFADESLEAGVDFSGKDLSGVAAGAALPAGFVASVFAGTGVEAAGAALLIGGVAALGAVFAAAFASGAGVVVPAAGCDAGAGCVSGVIDGVAAGVLVSAGVVFVVVTAGFFAGISQASP